MKDAKYTAVTTAHYEGLTHRLSMNQRTFNTEALYSHAQVPGESRFQIERYMPEWKIDRMRQTRQRQPKRVGWQ